MFNNHKLRLSFFRVPFRRLSTVNSHQGGIDDIRKAKYYTRNMDLKHAVDMMNDSKYIYNAALRDCEVLQVPVSE